MNFHFLDADYSGIEARIVNWLAGQEDALERFRRQDAAPTKAEKKPLCSYRIQAAEVFGVPVTEVTEFPQRFVGKGLVLGAGFGLGYVRFRASCLERGLDLPEGLEYTAIDSWRARHKKVVQWWKQLENAAKQAILKKGQTFKAGEHISFTYKTIGGLNFLLMKLPSGREIAYPKARISSGKFEGTTAITFFGNYKGANWGDITIWGGVFANNCLAGDTQVCSHRRGWVRLDSLTIEDKVWDGVEFVQHQGLLRQGKREVMEFQGMRCTPDHEFLTGEGWVSAQTACTNPRIQLYSPHGDTASVGAHEFDRPSIRRNDSHGQGARGWQKDHMDLRVQMWISDRESGVRIDQERPDASRLRQTMPVQPESTFRGEDEAWHDQPSRLPRSGRNAGEVLEPEARSVAQLRGPGNQGMRTVEGELRELLGGHGAVLLARIGYRPGEQQWGLYPGELSVGDSETEHPQPAMQRKDSGGTQGFLGHCRSLGDQADYTLLSGSGRTELGPDHQHPAGLSEQVYDLKNCGPRHQFAVRGSDRSPILVAHNCTQGTAADIMVNGAHLLERNGYEIATLIHDQCLSYHKEGQTVEEYVRLLTTLPDWAKGLPLAAEGALAPFYTKD